MRSTTGARIKKLKSARKYRAHSNSRSCRLTGKRRSMLTPDLRCHVFFYIRAPSDQEAVAHDPEVREFDSIYMTVPTSTPRLLDLPLPPSSSPSDDSSLYLGHQECYTIPLVSSESDLCRLTDTPFSHAHIQILKQVIRYCRLDFYECSALSSRPTTASIAIV